MGRIVKESTLAAIKLIGSVREDGEKHTTYSAAKKVGAKARTVYLYLKNHPNLASSSNEGVSGEGQ